MPTGQQLARSAVVASASSVVLLISALIAGVALRLNRGVCSAGGASNLLGPIGVVLYAVAVVAFAVGLTLTLLARRAGQEVPPAEGLLIVAPIAFLVVFLALAIANTCPSGE